MELTITDWFAYFAFFLAGLALVAEVIVTSGGLLTVVAILSALSGASLLWLDQPYLQAWSNGLLLALGICFIALLALLLYFSIRLYRRRSSSGTSTLLNAQGVIIDAQNPLQVYAHVQGERWQVVSPEVLRSGQRVKVTAVHGLTLTVVPVSP